MAGAVSSTSTFSFQALHSQLRQVLIHYLSRPQQWKSFRGDFESIVVIIDFDRLGVSAERSIGGWWQGPSLRLIALRMAGGILRLFLPIFRGSPLLVSCQCTTEALQAIRLNVSAETSEGSFLCSSNNSSIAPSSALTIKAPCSAVVFLIQNFQAFAAAGDLQQELFIIKTIYNI